MKIAVCIKEVPDSAAPRQLNPATGRLVRQGDGVLNSYDSHAVEAALQLKESGAAADATIVAVTMSPESAMRTLQKALALGADEAVLITDPGLAGSDILATARALAAHLKADAYDLVILGQQAADSDCWVLAPAIGELLGVPVVTQASKVEIDGGALSVERQTESGYEGLSAALPALVSVSDALNEPRYPSLKAIMGAKRKPTRTLSVADLGLDPSQVGQAGSGTSVLGQAQPPAKSGGVKIEDDGSAADQIVAFLADKHLV